MTREQFVTILYRLNGSPVDVGASMFADVSANSRSFGYIAWAYVEGIIAPDANGNFRPTQMITRAEIATMITRMGGYTETGANTFSDINDHPDRDNILRASNAGLFWGYDGSFRPDHSATRYEVVAVLLRYLLGDAPTEDMWAGINVPFTDVSRDHWAFGYVALSWAGYSPAP